MAEQDDPETVDAGASALKRTIRTARERQGITSDLQLASKAGVSYDTLMNWWSGRTTPRPAELKKVADVLDVRLVDLMDAYEGRDPEPPSLVDAIRELADEIRVLVYDLRLSRVQQEEGTAAILRALGVMAQSGRARPETPARSERAERVDKP